MKLRAFGLLTPALIAGCFAIGCSSNTTTDEEVESSKAQATERAADATGRGPLSITDAEYKLPASVDPDVLADRNTEVWGHMWRPANLESGKKHPLIVFLHGNHGTCGTGANPRRDNNTQYTTQGTCPPGYVVVPNHMGYAYVAERLASWGYFVVSINANRGITAGGPAAGDGGLNLARGRLVLKHLEHLTKWAKTAGTTPASLGVDLAGTLDFSEIGMMGHSRGGEGVRAAYVQYNDPGSPWPAKIQSPLGFKGIFEIGPVDGQTSRVLDANGTAWNVILPMCDGDVSNLQGMKPFDRMLAKNGEGASAAAKGMFGVWGANHNFFNTEWQQSDASGCRGAGNVPLWSAAEINGSAKQRTTGLHALMGFFRANVGQDRMAAYNKVYDPQFGLPEELEAVTHIGRAYADSASADNTKVLEDFTKPAGTSLSGEAIVLGGGATMTHGSVPEHDAALKAGLVTWTAPGATLEIPVGGVDATTMSTLDVRVSLKNVTASVATPTSFSIALVNGDGTTSNAVSLKSYVELAHGGHVLLDTARIPLRDFGNAQLANVKGIKLTFDETESSSVYLASIRVSRPLAASDSNTNPGTQPDVVSDPGTGNVTNTHTDGNAVADIRTESDAVEIELASQDEFLVHDELPRLLLGSDEVVGASYKADGSTNSIVFKLSAEQFAAVKDGVDLKVQYGTDAVTHEWSFGKLDKSLNH
ncbi:MAG: hypothetical protein KIT84_35085 [Labilithrix sp.]|nr:hypothetical protein [Labilithrix sp.]MCW5816275.1 hypothetical protein [Labilithrix sp.]